MTAQQVDKVREDIKEKRRRQWLEAYKRAQAEGLIPELDAVHGNWIVGPYRVWHTGEAWHQLACNCKGANHMACKHRAAVAKVVKETGVRP